MQSTDTRTAARTAARRPLTPLMALLAALVLPTAAMAQADGIERGGYLVRAFGCADCHTPMKMGSKGPERDVSRGLSGHPQDLHLPPPPHAKGPWVWGGAGTNTAFWGPWGVSYAANLTPDPATGIGGWTAEQFIGALRTGRHAGSGRPIAPPMPWQAFGTLNDNDLRAMFAWLRSQPAVVNAVPDYQPPRQPPGQAQR